PGFVDWLHLDERDWNAGARLCVDPDRLAACRSRRRRTPPPPLVLGRREVVQRRVPSARIVEPLDVVEDCPPGLLPVHPDVSVDELALERREESLRHCVGVSLQLHLNASFRSASKSSTRSI